MSWPVSLILDLVDLVVQKIKKNTAVEQNDAKLLVAALARNEMMQ